MAGELASYTESLDADPARLAAVQERRAALNRLVRASAAAPPPRPRPASPRRPTAPVTPVTPSAPGELGGPGKAGSLTVGARDGIGDLTAVLAWTKIAAARLNELEGDDDRIAGLAQRKPSWPRG